MANSKNLLWLSFFNWFCKDKFVIKYFTVIYLPLIILMKLKQYFFLLFKVILYETATIL